MGRGRFGVKWRSEAFRTPRRCLGAAGCAAGAEVKPGSLEGPGLAETPGAGWARLWRAQWWGGLVGGGTKMGLCPRPSRRSLAKGKRL